MGWEDVRKTLSLMLVEGAEEGPAVVPEQQAAEMGNEWVAHKLIPRLRV